MRNNLLLALLALPTLPLVMGAQGDGCAAGSKSPAPDVRGTWGIEYDDTIGVEAKIGGAVYTAELGAQGGSFTINHAGKPYTFNLDCTRADVVCPSEAWPSRVVVEQRDVQHQHQMIVNLPAAQCSGALTSPAPGTCGAGTSNPNCDLVCGGGITVKTQQAFGVIGESGDSFRLYLGGGVVTNGINCAMLGYSVADADLVSTGRNEEDWEATQMKAGLVTIGFAGACLFAGQMSGTDQAALVGAELEFTTGFTGAKQ
ncbi:MAG: hypothetical protein H0T46_06155 [Deltaproteobacteria bacterium]|nr:hypothetical protein [Deltaproteobacteria bacterium]